MVKTMLFIIKITHGCNMKCRYCYDRHSKLSNLMSINMLDNIMKWIGEFCENSGIQKAKFVWHGGEPLLAGIEFFELIPELQQKHLKDMIIENGIQTNGTLITEDLIDFFKANNFKISISLDGFREINDKYRVFKDENGSFDLVLKNIELLKKNNMAVGISSVVHCQNYNFLMDNYKFFKEHNLNYNLVFDFNSNYSISYLNGMREELCKLFLYWCKDSNPLKIRFFINILESFLTGFNNECTFSKFCCTGDELIVIDNNGDLYPCSTYVEKEEYKFGSIYNLSDINMIKKTDAYNRIVEDKAKTEKKCKVCKYYNLCFGGCPTRYQENCYKDYYCEVWKSLFHDAEKILNQNNFIKET